MSPKDAIKNGLMLDVNDAIMQANNALMDLQFIKYNCLNKDIGIWNEVIELVE